MTINISCRHDSPHPPLTSPVHTDQYYYGRSSWPWRSWVFDNVTPQTLKYYTRHAKFVNFFYLFVYYFYYRILANLIHSRPHVNCNIGHRENFYKLRVTKNNNTFVWICDVWICDQVPLTITVPTNDYIVPIMYNDDGRFMNWCPVIVNIFQNVLHFVSDTIFAVNRSSKNG